MLRLSHFSTQPLARMGGGWGFDDNALRGKLESETMGTKLTRDEMLRLTNAVEHVSRNAAYPRRKAATPDEQLPVYRSIMVTLSDKPHSRPRRLTCGEGNTNRNDVWVWSPSGSKVEARINLKDPTADEQLARYAVKATK